MAIRLWLTVLISLFVATSAHALPEICGNGLDDDGTGGDLACPDPDKDADGHLAGADCDDNDRMIFPGVVTAKGCSAGQYRTCQPNGTYTACSATTLCEKTGSGRCFYIDCGTGSNSNAGTFAAPWKDFRMVSYFQNAGSRPAGWQALVPGDVIYLKGTGACTTAYDPGPDLQNDVMFYAYGPSMSGTATAPITIKRYPGSTAVIRPPFTATYDGTAFMNISASYYKYEDLEITQGFSRQIALFDNSNDVEITRTYIHDNNGAREINPAAIYSAENARLKIHHNRFVDNCDRDETAAYDNVTHIVLFNDNGQGNHTITNNLFSYTADPQGTTLCRGIGIKFKHGASSANAGQNVVQGNIFWNLIDGIRTATAGMRVRNNLFVSLSGWAYVQHQEDPTYHQDEVFENNTVVGSGAFQWGPNYAYSIGSTIIRKNVFVDDAPNYYIDNGIYRLDPYGDDTAYTSLILGHKLQSTENCFHNSAGAPLMFNVFGDASRGALGAFLTFTSWRALGYETGSTVVNPGLDAYFRASATACSGYGWLSGTPGPTRPTGVAVVPSP